MLLVVTFALGSVFGFLRAPRGHLLASAAVICALGVGAELTLLLVADRETHTLLPLTVALVGVAGLVVGAFVRSLAAPPQAR